MPHVACMGEERKVYKFRVVFWDILNIILTAVRT
jgi:hypothetical protein